MLHHKRISSITKSIYRAKDRQHYMNLATCHIQHPRYMGMREAGFFYLISMVKYPIQFLVWINPWYNSRLELVPQLYNTGGDLFIDHKQLWDNFTSVWGRLMCAEGRVPSLNNYNQNHINVNVVCCGLLECLLICFRKSATKNRIQYNKYTKDAPPQSIPDTILDWN